MELSCPECVRHGKLWIYKYFMVLNLLAQVCITYGAVLAASLTCYQLQFWRVCLNTADHRRSTADHRRSAADQPQSNRRSPQIS